MEKEIKLNREPLFYKKGAIPGRVLSVFNLEDIDYNEQHCCELMDMFLADPRISLLYSSMYREYYIPLRYKKDIASLQMIFYCSWCAKKLPRSVRDEWFELLEKEHGLDDPWSLEQEKLVPEEFMTDQWWKKRGL
jgi:hypothetical protein